LNLGYRERAMLIVVMMGCAGADGETGETGAGGGLVWVRNELACTSEEPRTWDAPRDIAALHVWSTWYDPETNKKMQNDITEGVAAQIAVWASEGPAVNLDCGWNGTYDITHVVTWARWE
jgi:hypothetical protein